MTNDTFETIMDALTLRENELGERIERWQGRGGGLSKANKQALIADARAQLDRIQRAKAELVP